MKTIQLTKGKQAVIDDEDLERVSAFKWFFANGYAQRSIYQGYNKAPKTIQLQRFVMGDPSKLDVDHINHDTLDNRKSNLRTCSRAGNARNSVKQINNTTGYKGVNHHGNRFRAQIYVEGKNKHLGLFDRATEAAKAYNTAAKRYFGEFAYLNQLESI